MAKNAITMVVKITSWASTEDFKDSAPESNATPRTTGDLHTAEASKAFTIPADPPAKSDGTTTTEVSQVIKANPRTITTQSAHKVHPAVA